VRNSGFKPRKKPMKQTPLKREKPINKESAKQKVKNQQYRKVSLVDVTCFLCANDSEERHHIYTQAEAAFMRTNKINILPLCSFCHKSITGKEREFRDELRIRMPERMAVLDVMFKTMGKVNRNRSLGT